GHLHRCLEALGRHVETHQGWVIGGDVENAGWALGNVGDDAEVAPVGHAGGELGDGVGRCDAGDFGGRGRESVPSVNQRLPSEPLVMARGWLLAAGTLNCFSAPTGAASAALPTDKTRPTASAAASTLPALGGMSPTPSPHQEPAPARWR